MIIVVCNTKGGTSKSTLAVNLAVEYHRQGNKVIILETDPTVSTASQWAADRENTTQPPITTVRKTGRLGSTIDDLAATYDTVIIDTAGKDSAELRSAAYKADRAGAYVETATNALAEIPKEIEFDLADTIIYHRQAYAQSLSEGLSVVEYDNAKAKAEIQLLAQEITNLLTTAEGEEN